MNHYVEIKHPITGERIALVPTGQTRTEERGGTPVVEAEGLVITPRSHLTRVWFRREDILGT